MNWFDTKMKKIGAGMGAMAILFAIGTLIPGDTKAAPPSTPVTVLNTPLPTTVSGTVAVSGTVGISGTPSVNVGTPNVSVTNTPTVNLAGGATVGLATGASVSVNNTAASPVLNLDVERKARVPYRSSRTCITTVGISECDVFFAQVPSGTRLVAQMVSAALTLAAGSAPPSGYMTDTFGFLLGLQGTVGISNSGFAYGGFSQPITAYFDSPTSVELAVAGNFLAGTQSFALTGYLESCAVTGCPAIVQ